MRPFIWALNGVSNAIAAACSASTPGEIEEQHDAEDLQG